MLPYRSYLLMGAVIRDEQRMRRDDLSNQERQLLDSLGRQLRKARRSGAALGVTYALLGVSLLYLAIVHYGGTEPMAAVCYGGAVVLAVDAYRRLR